MISWYVALLTLLVCFGLHSYVGHLKPDVDWGSVGERPPNLTPVTEILEETNCGYF